MHAPIYGYNSVPEPISTSEQTPIRTNINTPEGLYRQTMTVNECFRSNRINQIAGPVGNAPVRVSFLKFTTQNINSGNQSTSLPSTSAIFNNNHASITDDNLDDCAISTGANNVSFERICFNIGREIYIFDYSGVNGTPDSAKPVDKRVYKGTFPTCHNFKKDGATINACLLLIGFSAGQIQLIDPCQKELQNSKLFNEERQIDRTAVTCLRWIPDQKSLFVASHASGNLYLYNEELDSPQISPVYQVTKQGVDYIIYSCKSKTQKNPCYRWSIGSGAINAFEFSGENSNLIAVVSQDGFLRVFNWQTMELYGCMKSYFGGLICLAWSPDYKYIATGGEDDMLSLYSVLQNRVICRGQRHKSWIAEIAFDHYAPFIANQCSHRNSTGNNDLTFADESMLAATAELNLQATRDASACLSGYSLNSDDDLADNFNTPIITRPINTIGQQLSGASANSSYYQFIEDHQIKQNNVNKPNLNSITTKKISSADYNKNFKSLLRNETLAIGGAHIKVDSYAENMTTFPVEYLTSQKIDDNDFNLQSRIVYRIGTVGHDCQLCLWDISEDMLLSTSSTQTNSKNLSDACDFVSASSPGGSNPVPTISSPKGTTVIPIGIDNAIYFPKCEDGKNDTLKLSEKDPGLRKNGEGSGKRFKRLHKRGFSLGSRLIHTDSRQNGSSSNGVYSVDGTLKRQNCLYTHFFGTPQCPRIEEIPVIEPLICKKVANERLGSLHFRKDCIVTACQEGYICTWARPNEKMRQDQRHRLSMSECCTTNECVHNQNHHCKQLSADNFASTCV